jgi:kumamolisin
MYSLKGLTAMAVLSVAALLTVPSALAGPVDLIIGLKERTPISTLAENATRFGVTYTPAEIRKAAGPSEDEYRNVIESLKQQGFTIIKETKSHLFITVRSDQSTVENTFQTRLSVENGIRRLQSYASLPSYLGAVKTVVGLDNSNKRKPHFKVLNAESTAVYSAMANKKPHTPPGVSPATIKTSYGFDPIYKTGVTGKGQAIAIATYDGLKVPEITAYFTKIGLKTKRTVDVISFNGTAPYNADSAMETELDAEFAGMIAPGSDIHVFASNENSDAGELAMFTAILDDNRAKVVNYSWGSCEKNLSPAHKTAMDTVFSQAVAQGVNIMVASGDSGSDGCGDGSIVTDYPSSNPNVTSVGGTTLVATKSAFETAWSGSGGGVSGIYATPSYQSSLGSAYVKRAVPDVAFNADPKTGEAAWETNSGGSSSSPTWVILGGTSIAAPQWAGFLALVGEARAKAKLKSVGFVNPILYGLSAADKATNFSDVISGSNGKYKAATGYDAVTGLGSMKASALFSKLTK